MKVTISTKGLGGKNLKQDIKIHSNDPENKVVLYKFTCQIREFAEIKPKTRKIRLYGPMNTEVKYQATIVPAEKTPFKITEAKAKEGVNFVFELKETVIPGKPDRVSYVLNVENKKNEEIMYHDIIYLKTDHSVFPMIEMEVYGQIYKK